MAFVKVVTENDIGKGLIIEGNKLIADVDGVSIQLDEQGKLKAVFPVDVQANNVSVNEDNELVVAMSNGTELKASLAKFLNIDTNTHVESGAVVGTNLELTLNNSEKVTIDVSSLVGGVERGDELQSLGGVSLGFLVQGE